MEYSTKESEIGKSLSKFEDNADEDMEEDEDEEDAKFLVEYFKKRFLLKRNRLNNAKNDMPSSDEENDPNSIEQMMANLSMDEIFVKAKSVNLIEKLYGITQIRKLISTPSENSLIINDLLNNNEILPILVECLSLPNSELQFEAAWIFTNIAAGNSQQTNILFDAFIHLALIKLFGSDNCELNVANQALWALANIMADNNGFCYHCISAGIMESIKKQIKRFPESIPFLQTVSWVMGQMSHLRDSPSFKETAWDLFPALWDLLKHQQNDLEICINAIWGLSYLTDKDFDILMNFDKRVIKDVAPHLTSPILELQTACLHFFGNCVSGTDEITQQIINCGVLKHLHKFLNHLNLNLQEETAWMLSNILAGTKDQITAVFAADLMPSIIGLTESDEISVTEKAVWAIANVPLCGTLQHINLLLDLNIIPSLCKLLLLCPKKEIIQSVLEAINGIQRQSCDRREEIRQKMLAAGVIDHLRQLCNHESDAIESNAMQLLNDLFNDSI